MGDYWLPHLAKWHADAGLDFVEFNGGRTGNWRTLSRSSGGYDKIMAIQEHHDAAGFRSGLSAATAHFRDHENAPVGAISTDRDGVHWIGAAGATNTSGLGGPLATSRGTIPLDAANRYVISRESANNGVGEIWRQLESIKASTVAIIKGLANDGVYNARTRQFEQVILDPAHRGDVHAHFEWAPTRKIDPAGGRGQYPYAVQTDRYLRWDMDRLRYDLKQLLLTQEDDDMQPLPFGPERVYDSRAVHQDLVLEFYRNINTSLGWLHPNQSREIFVGFCEKAAVQVTYVGEGSAGFAKLSPGGMNTNTAVIGADAGDRVEYGPIAPVLTPNGYVRVAAGPGTFDFVIDVWARG